MKTLYLLMVCLTVIVIATEKYVTPVIQQAIQAHELEQVLELQQGPPSAVIRPHATGHL